MRRRLLARRGHRMPLGAPVPLVPLVPDEVPIPDEPLVPDEVPIPDELDVPLLP
ncbi:MAG: hypothetical protein HOO96_15375 [Polyangiaceae bacterium]|nr:hypothetical protein [Polyangiaceae bacterium]